MSNRIVRALPCLPVAAALVVGGCASGSGSPAPSGTSASSPAIRAATQQQLRADLRIVTSAAARGRLADARAALTTLNADLAAAGAAGSITSARLAQIRAAANSVDAELVRLTTPTTPPTTKTVTVAPPTPKHHHGKGGGGDDGGGRGD